MTLNDFKNRFEIYKKFIEAHYKIVNSIKRDIENNGRLEILMPGLSQLGVMFTSQLKLIPREDGNLDLTSLCSISRSILEFTNTIHFYSLAEVSPNEIQFRLDLYNYLSISERFIEVKHLDAPFKKLKNSGLSKMLENEFKDKLIRNDFFKMLKEQGRIKEDNIKNSDYIDRKNLQKARKIQMHVYDNFYSLYSTFVHSSPLAIDIYKDFLINHDDRTKDQYKYVTGVIEMSAGFIAVLLKETEKYTKGWSEFLEKDEIEIVNQFASNLN